MSQNPGAGGRSPLFWALFSLRGRISRQIYWLIYGLLICVQSAILAQLFGGEEASYHGLVLNVALPLLLVTLWINVAISVKRLHDAGYSGFLAVAVLIPIVQVAFFIWVGIIPGTPDPNTYGDRPDVPPP